MRRGPSGSSGPSLNVIVRACGFAEVIPDNGYRQFHRLPQKLFEIVHGDVHLRAVRRRDLNPPIAGNHDFAGIRTKIGPGQSHPAGSRPAANDSTKA